MKKLLVLMIYLIITLTTVRCGSDQSTHIGTIVDKKYQEPVWGIGIGQTGVGFESGWGVVPELKSGQYLITVHVLGKDEVFSVGQEIYTSTSIGDTVTCDSTPVCTFEGE